MPPTGTPSQRTTRSGSSTNAVTLNDIKFLIESSKSEILAALKSEIDELKNTVSSLSKKVEKLDSRHTFLENRCRALEDQCDRADHRVRTEDLLHEAEERQRKRKHIIVVGLPESKSGTVEERAEGDKSALKDLVADIGVEDFEAVEIRRIGRVSSSRPRLLRVKCKDHESKSNILRKARFLRNNTRYRNMFINPDLTPLQREQNKQLRSELHRRRAAGDRVVIRRGQIVDAGEEEQHFR